jgi:predicted  nucleic acid-binding Zn-ribbon protein
MNALDRLEEKIKTFKDSYDKLIEENIALKTNLENAQLELLKKEDQIESVIQKVEALLSQV